jgi:hypothetical protein
MVVPHSLDPRPPHYHAGQVVRLPFGPPRSVDKGRFPVRHVGQCLRMAAISDASEAHARWHFAQVRITSPPG